MSIIDLLPKVVAEGKREASRILDGISDDSRITLQTNELVVPSRDSNFQDLWKQLDEETRNNAAAQSLADGPWKNRMVYGDNLLVMQALLAGDSATGLPSMRGQVDLIYIDPPFDSKVDYRAKIELPGASVESQPTVIEQFAYADTWSGKVGGEDVRGTVAYLRYMYPRLVLMRELLSEHGSIYVHIDWHIGHYLKILLDDVFGKDNFRNEITWKRGVVRGMKVHAKFFPFNADYIMAYTKSNEAIWNGRDIKYEIKIPERDYQKHGYSKDEFGYFVSSARNDYTDKSVISLHQENRVYVTNGGTLFIVLVPGGIQSSGVGNGVILTSGNP